MRTARGKTLPVAKMEISTPLATERRRIEYVSIETLNESPRNVRTHSGKQIRQIAKSIDRFGFQVPIVISSDGTILAGHGRYRAAKLLGMTEVPCIRVIDLSPAEQRAYALADNKIADNAGTDRQLLAFELGELAVLLPQLEVPADIELTGYSAAEIDALQHDFGDEEHASDDDMPVPGNGPLVSRRGDLWRLGKHKLLCGDAREKSSYRDLLASGSGAEMVITDPPFNVPIAGHVAGRGRVKHSEFAFASGEMTEEQFHAFLIDSIGGMSMACRPGALIYVFTDWRSIELFCRVGRDLGLILINICVWHKTTPGQGSFYRSAHELICVFAKPGGERRNNIQLGQFGRSRTNVWSYASPNKFWGATEAIRQHPTPKPVSMIAEAIKDASTRGAIILDAFLGSGTTILAAEKVGRVAYGIEYEPRYVDLAIRRWQHATGRDAVLEPTNQTFDAFAEVGRD